MLIITRSRCPINTTMFTGVFLETGTRGQNFGTGLKRRGFATGSQMMDKDRFCGLSQKIISSYHTGLMRSLRFDSLTDHKTSRRPVISMRPTETAHQPKSTIRSRALTSTLSSSSASTRISTASAASGLSWSRRSPRVGPMNSARRLGTTLLVAPGRRPCFGSRPQSFSLGQLRSRKERGRAKLHCILCARRSALIIIWAALVDDTLYSNPRLIIKRSKMYATLR